MFDYQVQQIRHEIESEPAYHEPALHECLEAKYFVFSLRAV